MEGVKCLKGILEQVDGEGMSFAEVLPMLSFFQTRSVKQTTTFRGPIEIGDSVKINVYGYLKVGVYLFVETSLSLIGTDLTECNPSRTFIRVVRQNSL